MPKVSWKPGTLLGPLPTVMVSCGSIQKPNIITIAWTGIINSDPAMTYISVMKSRFSHRLIEESGEFAINLTTRALALSADLCGVKSGRDVDKFKLCGLTPEKAFKISAPLIEESPVSLECRVEKILELGSHDMFLSRIVAVDVDERYIEDNGRLRMDKCRLISFCHGEYFDLGKRTGTFGYSVRKKKNGKRQDRRQLPGTEIKGKAGSDKAKDHISGVQDSSNL